MKTFNQIKRDILVWSIILGVFAVLTAIAVNYDRMRNSFEGQHQRDRGKAQATTPPMEGSYSVVLTQ